MIPAAISLVAVLSAAACSGSSRPGPHDSALDLDVPQHVTVGTASVTGLGTIIVDGQGHSLYMFPPDAGGNVSCVGPCAGTWPPLVIKDGARPTARGGVHAGLLSTLADPNTGERIVTYGGYPLYRYAGDVHAGTADGQALFLNGGPWYVLDDQADPITATEGGDR